MDLAACRSSLAGRIRGFRQDPPVEVGKSTARVPIFRSGDRVDVGAIRPRAETTIDPDRADEHDIEA